jgi:hypothetical protein
LWITFRLCAQEWGDKRNVDDLYRYLSVIDHKRFDSDYFWAAMAELTPSTMDVLFRPNDGLRKLADNVARNVTTWYRDLWWKTTSIAAVDFFHSTDIIDVSIDANLKRARCSSAVPTTLSSATTIQQTAAEERSTATDRRRFYLGPRNLDFAESTSETTPISLDPTSPLPRITARRRRPKNNTTAIVELNLPVITNTNFNWTCNYLKLPGDDDYIEPSFKQTHYTTHLIVFIVSVIACIVCHDVANINRFRLFSVRVPVPTIFNTQKLE